MVPEATTVVPFLISTGQLLAAVTLLKLQVVPLTISVLSIYNLQAASISEQLTVRITSVPIFPSGTDRQNSFADVSTTGVLPSKVSQWAQLVNEPKVLTSVEGSTGPVLVSSMAGLPSESYRIKHSLTVPLPANTPTGKIVSQAVSLLFHTFSGLTTDRIT